MPDTNNPKIEPWVSKLAEIVDTPDKDTYFVGHSIGCQTIMRYFATLPENTYVGGAVFIAGWLKLDNLEDEEVTAIADSWLNTPINFEKIKKVCRDIVVYLSSNEPYGCVEENKKMFEDNLNAKVVIQENKGHYNST